MTCCKGLATVRAYRWKLHGLLHMDCLLYTSYSDILVLDGPYVNQRCTKEIFEKLRKEDPDLHVAVFAMNEEEVEMAYRAPFVMVGSDCGFVHRHGHPRGAGTFPKVIRQYVRERKIMTLIEARCV